MAAAFKKYQVVILVIILVIGGFVAYSYLMPKPQAALTATAPSGSSGVDQDLIALLSELKSITLDSSLFSDPVYQSLQDFSQQLVPEPIGRPDPFAPLTGTTPLTGQTGPSISSSATAPTH